MSGLGDILAGSEASPRADGPAHDEAQIGSGVGPVGSPKDGIPDDGAAVGGGLADAGIVGFGQIGLDASPVKLGQSPDIGLGLGVGSSFPDLSPTSAAGASSGAGAPAPPDHSAAAATAPPGLRTPSPSKTSRGGRVGLTPGSAGGRSSARISARLSQPVEGVALTPFLFLRNSSGDLVNAQDERVSFRWERSATHRACAYSNCRFLAQAPADRAAALPAKVQCAAMAEAGAAPERSLFCCAECYQLAWPGHKQFLTSAGTEGGGLDFSKAEYVPLSLPGEGEGAAKGGGGRAGGAGSASSPSKSADAGDGKSEEDGGDEELTASEAAFAAAERLYRVPAASSQPGLLRGKGGAAAGAGQAEWIDLGTGSSYVPTAHDVWHQIRLVVEANLGGADGVLTETATTAAVLPRPPVAGPRRFVPLTRDPRTGRGSRADMPDPEKVAKEGDRRHPHTVRVVSYNTLAEIYANQGVYPYCPTWALSWQFRRDLVLRELLRLDADLICLQEVQGDHFQNMLQKAMQEAGYESQYKQKTREPMGLEGKVDGCAFFYRASRFRLIEKYVVEFNDAATTASRTEMNRMRQQEMTLVQRKQQQERLTRQLQRLMRDNVAQVMVLEMTRDVTGKQFAESTKKPRLCVANTHLFWDPEFADVKLWQTHMLVRELEKLTTKSGLPLILCGDFNSEPSSAVHTLLAGNAKVGHRFQLAREELPADPHHILPVQTSRLSHGLMLQSAYSSVLGQEPRFTNYTEQYVGCLDYIWCSADRATPVAVLELPPEQELTALSRSPLPNPQHPSDHLSLCADIVIGMPSHGLPLQTGPGGGLAAAGGGMRVPQAGPLHPGGAAGNTGGLARHPSSGAGHGPSVTHPMGMMGAAGHSQVGGAAAGAASQAAASGFGPPMGGGQMGRMMGGGRAMGGPGTGGMPGSGMMLGGRGMGPGPGPSLPGQFKYGGPGMGSAGGGPRQGQMLGSSPFGGY